MKRLGRQDERVLVGFLREFYRRSNFNGFLVTLLAVMPLLAPLDPSVLSDVSTFRDASPLGIVTHAVVTLYPHARLKVVTPQAQLMLEEFFGENSTANHHLPEALAGWVRAESEKFRTDRSVLSASPLMVRKDGTCLRARLFVSPTESLVLLQRDQGPCETARLQALGLTPREAEVLACVAQGMTNAEIGSILAASPRTVQKHLEHIFLKLGVNTRTAAVAAARQATSNETRHSQ